MNSFCYWDCRNLPDTIILLIYLATTALLIIVTVLRLRVIKSYGERGQRILRIHILIIFWGVTFCFQLLLQVSTYLTTINGDYNIEMDNYSKNFSRIDVLPAFLIQTIFLSICKIFFKGLYSSIPISLMARWQIRFSKLLHFYYYTRIVVMVILIVLLNIFALTDDIQIYLNLTIYMLVVDCFCCNFILIISRNIFLRRFQQANRLQQSDLKMLKKQYTIMIITSLYRIILAILFIILPMRNVFSFGQQCLGPFQSNPLKTIGFNGIGNLFDHIIPILWVLKIYNISAYDDSTNISSDQGEKINLIQTFVRDKE